MSFYRAGHRCRILGRAIKFIGRSHVAVTTVITFHSNFKNKIAISGDFYFPNQKRAHELYKLE
jgi:hypothetical protein